jgi:hypothetical protein
MRQMFTKAGGENLTEYNINTEISRPQMNLRETNIAIKFIKDNFEKVLAKEMNLTRVSAPLFVRPETGLNDTLSGTERPVSFDIKNGSFVVFYDMNLEASIGLGIFSYPVSLFLDEEGYLITGAVGSINEELIRKGIDMSR